LSELELAYRRCFPVIREKCRRMLGDAGAADDVAQETFMRLWKSRFVDADPRTLAAWVYRTSTRLAIDQLRERARRAGEGGVAEEMAAAAPNLDDALATRQMLERLAAVLPRQELEIALLHRLDELTQQEIATVAEVSARTVRRCLQRLDQRLETLRKEIVR
jgi:RNA polymerase sigma-70 factor (ECF subfamily)